MPTGIRKSRKKGKRYEMYDRRTGRVVGHANTKRDAGIFVGKRDKGHK